MRLSAIRIPRRHRRAILIYLLTIVTPVCVLLWLGVQSFDRQRQALATLTVEKLSAAIEARTREAAETAFRDDSHPIATHFFAFEDGGSCGPRCGRRSPRRSPPHSRTPSASRWTGRTLH